MEAKAMRKGGSFLVEETPAEEVFTPEDFREEHKMLIKTTEDLINILCSSRKSSGVNTSWAGVSSTRNEPPFLIAFASMATSSATILSRRQRLPPCRHRCTS